MTPVTPSLANITLPFTEGQFFQVFREYNTAVWPAQIALLGLALLALVLSGTRRKFSDQAIAGILALLWLWQGIAYHFAFFSKINPVAYGFGTLSLAAAAVITWQGVIQNRLHFHLSLSPRSLLGATIVAFSLLGYPIAASLTQPYPELPTFGQPCPTTLFTLGLVGFMVPPYPRSPVILPVAWCLVGSQAAVLLGVTADYSLVVAGLLGVWLIARTQTGSR